MLRRLRSSRFLAVVGTSGSGKSSLVRSGLIPSLESGFMAGAGSSWRIAMLRPGEDPVGHLAAALDSPAVIGGNTELGETNRVLLEVTLRRSTLGLFEAVREARLPQDDNVLVIVDQFEELFRFRHSRQIANSRDEAIAFVKLLLEAAAQPHRAIYVVLTMRSDFIGDCMDFHGLPEAVNEGLYLVGRMSRDGLRAAITGPVAVAGGTIAPRLVNRVLNDLGDDHDQLPLVQHALMRTWDHWASRQTHGPIDIADYEAVGTFRDALSQHAEEAYDEAVAASLGHTTQRIFKALTDTFSDPRGVRRPTHVSELAAIAETSEDHVIEAVDIFRRPGRSFLMPPVPVPLTGRSIVDLSHESLMRCWGRLINWAEEERASAAFYVRLSQAALWFEQGTAGLWRNPELELAQTWKTENEPTATWARRYDAGFERAMAFLDRSIEERDRVAAEVERERRAKLRRTQVAAGVLAAGLAVVAALGVFAWTERRRAQANLELAREAVDESLAAADRDPSQMGADVPQVEELRRELLSKAERFYIAFMDQEPRSDEARRDLANAHLRLGHINRMLERRDDAEREYRDAITRFSALVESDPGNAVDRRALADAFNWLGETHRLRVGRLEEAAKAYDSALQIQQGLVKEYPAQAQYQEELARTLSNRGILRWMQEDPAAEGDFREAMRVLEPLTSISVRAQQEIGRVANNLGAVLEGLDRLDDAQSFYQRAITGHEQLVQRLPQNREYRLELAQFCNNFAMFLYGRDLAAAANQRSRQALDLLTDLARPAPSLAIERADANTLRGTILQAQNTEQALQSFAEALDLFAEMHATPSAVRLETFHVRYGDLLINLAALAKEPDAGERGRQLLARGLAQYSALAQQLARSGAVSEARVMHETLTRVSGGLDARDRPRLLAIQEQLRRVFDGRGPS